MNNYKLSKLGYRAFRTHNIKNPYLRLHHAIYLEHLLTGTDWTYSQLHPSMQSTLNRFFELVDRVALTTCKLESWEWESEDSVDTIIDAGVTWIESLADRSLLNPSGGRWGSEKTKNHWFELEQNLIRKIAKQRNGGGDLHVEEYPAQNGGNSDPTPAYEIFAGGFEYVPTIGVFPFYLFGERLSAWGIVKYGTLDSLAMATNESTLRKIKPRFPELSSSLTSQGIGGYNVDAQNFAGLVRAAKDANAKIYYLGVGHAAVSLLLRVLPPEKYREFRRNVIPLVNKRDDDAIKDLLLDNNHPALVLCDLGDPSLWKYLEENADSSRLLVMNGLKVPVGFGFSLAALPELLRTRQTFDDIMEAIRNWVTKLETDTDTDTDKEKIRLHDGIKILPVDEIRSPWLSAPKSAD